MGKQQKNSKANSIRRTKATFEIILSAGIIVAGVYLVKGAVTRAKPVEESVHYAEAETEPETEEITDPSLLDYRNDGVLTKDKFKGDLILVNHNHEFFGDVEDLVDINEKIQQTGVNWLSAIEDTNIGDMLISEVVYEPLISMTKDFYDLTGIDNLYIYGAYRPRNYQEQLYGEDLLATGSAESTRVAKPGFSEHECGLAFDFSTYPDWDYQGEGEYEWLTKNCYKYGFIIRYTEEKEDITKIQSEPWHLRYVGIPHAYFMTSGNICLEEYINLIETNYRYEGQHLEFADDSNNNYEVYFVPSNDAETITEIPVPTKYEYTVSGDNDNGFIVTVYKGANINSETFSQPAETQPSSEFSEQSEQQESDVENGIEYSNGLDINSQDGAIAGL